MNTTVRRPWPQWMLPAMVLAAALLAQVPLILNPGYFSHDELQWAAFAAQHPGWYFRDYLWSDVGSFQYRPLTFSLWLWLSDVAFARPQAFHAVFVAWGATNAAGLALLLRRFGLAPAVACAGALVFALSPYASYTHAWVGTLGDLIWVSCALGVGLVAQAGRAGWPTALACAALTSVALLSKEAGIVIPALAAMAWWWLGRPKAWGWAVLGASAPAAIYLLMRMGVLLFSPPESSYYQWGPAFVPQRWLEYQLFPWFPKRFEMINLLAMESGKTRFWVAVAVWAALAWTFARLGLRWLLAFVLLGAAALGPVLILTQSSNQYGYGFAAVMAALGAAAWPRSGRAGRAVLLLAALLSCWHGINVMRQMHQVGQVQARFSPALAEAVRQQGGDRAVRLRAADPDRDWVFRRLSHDIPSYHGVAIGDRVQMVEPGAVADYVIAEDGTLQPSR